MKTLILSALALILTLSGSAHAAQQTSSFLIDAGPCLGFSTAVERLVCFEEQVKQAQALEAASSGVVARSAQPALSIKPEMPAPAAASTSSRRQEAAPAAPVTAVEGFGLEEEGRLSKNKDGKNELISTIAEVKELAPNLHLITLVNGQVWRQMNTKNYRLSSGQEVRIYPTRWGNAYRLSVETLGSFIQVERVK